MSLKRFIARVWQRHRWSVPLCLAAALFFVRLGVEVTEHRLDGFDAGIQGLVNGWRGSIDTWMVLMTQAGSALPMVVLTAAVLVLLVGAGRPREARYLLLSALGCLLLNLFLKLLFHRARPDAAAPYLLPRPTSFSFPSGHTMCGAGVVGGLMVVVCVLRPPRVVWVSTTVLGCAFVLSVGVSRIYLGAHYPSDVLGGLLGAAAWLSAVTGWVYPRLLAHERTLPSP